MVAIRYVGSSSIRTIDAYAWNKENGYVCQVAAELAANLLTYPRVEFHAVKGSKITAKDAKTIADLTGVTIDAVKEAFSDFEAAEEPAKDGEAWQA